MTVEELQEANKAKVAKALPTERLDEAMADFVGSVQYDDPPQDYMEATTADVQALD